jgi:hypothetical protein
MGSPIIVLQGEFAVIQNRPASPPSIKTSIPTACHVVTLYSKERHIGILAHVDDYTSVTNLFNSIIETLQKNFSVGLSSGKFEAKLMGGSNAPYSQGKRTEIKKILTRFALVPKWVNLPSPRPQISINLSNGELEFFAQGKINQRLESLQKSEYGAFQDHLDLEYANVAGSSIPDFAAKKADRLESSISTGTVHSLLRWKRRAVLGSTPQVCQESLESKSYEMVEALSDTFPALLTSLHAKDFNRLFRQSAVDPKCIDLLKFLFSHAPFFRIDTNASGETSGTALDVATRNNNREAIEFLTQHK